MSRVNTRITVMQVNQLCDNTLHNVLPDIQRQISLEDKKRRLEACIQAITPVAKDVNDTSRILAQLRTNGNIGPGQVAAWNEMDVSLQQVKKRMLYQAQFTNVDDFDRRTDPIIDLVTRLQGMLGNPSLQMQA